MAIPDAHLFRDILVLGILPNGLWYASCKA